MFGSGSTLCELPDDLAVHPWRSALKTATALAAVLVSVFLLPTAASAETVVPPGNSAAAQYTDAIPTAGGNAVSNGSIDGGGGSAPSKVLGENNAKKLESQGATGREAAHVAAETAPAAVAPAAAEGVSHGGGTGQGGGTGSGSPASGGSGGADSHADSASSGQSGLGEVLGQATGSSSGQVGLWLPLVIVATIAWGAAYLWRRRRGIVH
jgi:hypothetical protein